MGRLLFGLCIFSIILKAELFYEIRHQDSTIFLLGSIHAGKASFYPLSDSIEQAYERSDIIVVEVDLNDPGVLIKGQLLFSNALYPKGETLATQLNPQIYQKWVKYASKNHISLEIYERLRPWAIVMQLSEWEIKKSAYSEQWGIDRYFLNKASTDGKKIVSLENIEDQFGLLSDPRFEEKLLAYSLDEVNNEQFSLDEMFKIWDAGDENRFVTILEEQSNTDPDYDQIVDRIIIQRNIKMAQKIQNLLSEGSRAMVIIGSAHLVGKEGVVALLRKKGYKIIKR